MERKDIAMVGMDKVQVAVCVLPKILMVVADQRRRITAGVLVGVL